MITSIRNLLKKSVLVENQSTIREHFSAPPSADDSQDPDAQERSTGTHYTLHPWLDLRCDGETCVLINHQNGSITSCNETAWVMLKKLRDSATRQQMVEALHLKFQVTTEQAQTDMESFFNHLNSLGYIQEDG